MQVNLIISVSKIVKHAILNLEVVPWNPGCEPMRNRHFSCERKQKHILKMQHVFLYDLKNRLITVLSIKNNYKTGNNKKAEKCVSKSRIGLAMEIL